MTDMFSMQSVDIKRLETELGLLSSRAVPFATKSTLNSLAFKAQKIARQDIPKRMVLRNRFTIQSVQVEQAKSLNIKRQESAVGSTQGYMEDQEFGTTKRKQGKRGIPITTSYAAGQGMSSQPRTRLARKPNSLAAIQLKKRAKRGSTRKQRNLIAVKVAAASSNKFAYLDLGRKKGIFRVVGGKRNPKVRMVHDLSETSVNIPRNAWLLPASDRAQKFTGQMYRRALNFQLSRLHIFND